MGREPVPASDGSDEGDEGSRLYRLLSLRDSITVLCRSFADEIGTRVEDGGTAAASPRKADGLCASPLSVPNQIPVNDNFTRRSSQGNTRRSEGREAAAIRDRSASFPDTCGV